MTNAQVETADMESRDHTIDDMRRAIEAGDEEALATASRDVESRGLDVRTLRDIISLFRDEDEYQDHLWSLYHLIGNADPVALYNATASEMPQLIVRSREWAETICGSLLRSSRSDAKRLDGTDFVEAVIATENRNSIEAVYEVSRSLATEECVPREPVERLGAWLRRNS